MAKRSLQKASAASSSKKQKPAKADSSSSCYEERILSEPAKGEGPAELQAFAKELKGLYTSNAVTASKTATVFKKAHLAGLKLKSPFDSSLKLQEPAQGEASATASEAKNAARTWQRWMRKHSSWPELYWAAIPLKNNRTKEVVQQQVPFLLPHEWLADYFLQPGAVEEALPTQNSPLGQELQRVKEAWDIKREPEEGSEPEQGRPMVPLGMHGDGVPVQGRMNQSTCDFITINLLASNAFQAKRVPITRVESRFVAGAGTIVGAASACMVFAEPGRRQIPRLQTRRGKPGQGKTSPSGPTHGSKSCSGAASWRLGLELQVVRDPSME